MRALLVHAWGDPTDLQLTECDDLTAGPGEVVIDVRAVGCNFADILLVQGKYQAKPAFPFAPGSELSGVVREVGPGVTKVTVGTRVLASVEHGAYATQARAKEAFVSALPERMSFEEAAAFTVIYHTSYFALVYRAPVHAGETVLVHGAAGGVGLSAVQIAKALGARVIATAGSAEKRAFVAAQGADLVLDSRDVGWVDEVLRATDGKGADHVYDPVGGEVFELSLKCIAFGGNLHVIGFASGRIPSCAMNRVMLKNIALVGLHLPAYRGKDPQKLHDATQALLAMYARGQLQVAIGARFPLAEAGTALQEISQRRIQGKVVLTT
ncbi:MAG: NADPH:quinone oxidoreductase family protein [Polyangiales bacterium]